MTRPPLAPGAGAASGFTLVEVVVALVVFQVGVLGVAALLTVAHDRMDRALRLEHALAAVESAADSIALFGYRGSASLARGPGRIGWERSGTIVLVWAEIGDKRVVEVATVAEGRAEGPPAP